MVRPRFLWMLFLSTSLEASMAQTVSQPQKEKSVQEAASAILDCTYDTSDTNYYLFWYKQQGGRVTLVIRQEAFKQHNATLNRFSVNFQKAAKTFSLEISDSQLGDSATYFCALMERHGDTGNREGLTETSDLSICVKWQEVAGLPAAYRKGLSFFLRAASLGPASRKLKSGIPCLALKSRGKGR